MEFYKFIDRLRQMGVFSLLKGESGKKPKRAKPWNDMAVVAETDQIANEIQAIIVGRPTLNQIEELLFAIRQIGLENMMGILDS